MSQRIGTRISWLGLAVSLAIGSVLFRGLGDFGQTVPKVNCRQPMQCPLY